MPEDLNAKEAHLEERLKKITELETEIKKREKAIKEKEKAKTIEAGDLKLDCESRRVFIAGKEINLTAKEFDVLALLAANPDVVVSRKKILDTVWGGDLPEDTRTLDTHIKQVRRAITPYSDRIVTLRGVGYRFEKNNG